MYSDVLEKLRSISGPCWRTNEHLMDIDHELKPHMISIWEPNELRWFRRNGGENVGARVFPFTSSIDAALKLAGPYVVEVLEQALATVRQDLVESGQEEQVSALSRHICIAALTIRMGLKGAQDMSHE